MPAGFQLAEVTGDGARPHAGAVQTAAGADAALPIEVEFPAGLGDTTTATITARFTGRS